MFAMPPKISIVRHAQGYHNLTGDSTLHDPLLTPLGKSQCTHLRRTYPHHSTISLILSSPLRRTIQTAAYSFAPALEREEVKFVCLPELQEVGDCASDTGTDVHKLGEAVAEMFRGEGEEFEWVGGKVDLSLVGEGWNCNQGYYAHKYAALAKRGADVRRYLFTLSRQHPHIVVVTHGAIAHFITEDWAVADPMLGTTYRNCEVREFRFGEGSTEGGNVKLVESRGRRVVYAGEEEGVVDIDVGVEVGRL
ncbi:phosphoglycerate mutase-like protein [Lentithecium fluviatile CBS 122367]|uniref:Phosphoglycerate mutase-like protein n=1 Tax=Lentithecium fluviatile CBS 122367 TaxID=1168545 RepID=A0A6G1JH08_9PLEO|nr:phosphoglycerate mutase-like protein [Lentithecium fluviatile CBS 122367]